MTNNRFRCQFTWNMPQIPTGAPVEYIETEKLLSDITTIPIHLIYEKLGNLVIH